MLLLGLYVGLWMAEKQAPRQGLSPDLPYNLATVTVLAGILFGRLVYAMENLSIFAQTPASLLSLNPSLISLPGAALGGLIAFLGYTQKKNLAIWQTLDLLTPTLAVFFIGLSLSHLAGGTAFGLPTELPWGIELWGSRRHPTQIYELIASLTVLGWWWRNRSQTAFPGELLLRFGALTAGWYLIIGAFRADSHRLPGGFRQEQVIAWLVLAITLWLLAQQERHRG
jgi:phosphatidylglycerol:prolipoprotein diacylglycerol transferase